MLKNLFRRLRPQRQLDPEEEVARQEGRKIRKELEALKTGDLEGPRAYTHRGKESRGAF